MTKELYLYSGIYSYTAEAIISQMEDNKAADIVLRMNTPGGDPQAAYGIIAKMVERTMAGQSTIIKIDGQAASAGAYMLPFATSVSAINVSEILLHRAAYSSGYEMAGMTADEALALAQMNKDLRAALEKRVNIKKFAAITGVTFDQIFDPKTRIDVRLTAAEALKVGLIDEIINIIDPAIAAMGRALFVGNIEAKKEKVKIMNTEQLKSEFPNVHAEIVAAGVNAENERVKSWMVFNDVDPKAVAEGIKGGKNISLSEMTELTRKSVSAEILGNLSAESAAANKPAAGAEKTQKETELAAFEAAVYSKLNFKK